MITTPITMLRCSETPRRISPQPVSYTHLDVYKRQDLALNEAEKIAGNMGDEYTSVEHLFLGMYDKPNAALKEIFRALNVDRNRFLQALETVRAGVRVTSDEPEQTYEALKKYGYDLVERARARQLDPVIGRDSEIRNVCLLYTSRCV